jgi:hypothetical protein
MHRPANIKPRFDRAFTGSLKIPSLTLSHHRDKPPTVIPGSKETILVKKPNKTYAPKKTADRVKAR